MGNENSKNKEATKSGKINEKHKNGSVNGLSANITSNGLEIAVNGETMVQQNGEPITLNLTTDSTEPEFIVVETDSKPAEAPVIPEVAEAVIQKEEVKESNEAPTDVSLPATDSQPESSSSGEEAATVIVHQEDFEYPHRKAEISTQTDRKTEADISTQTGEDDDDTTTNIEGPVEEVVVIETVATEEETLDESIVVIAEEAVGETASNEPLANQTAGIIIEEVVLQDDVYENIVFRAERVVVTDVKIYDPEEESMNWRTETEPKIVAEPETNPNKFIIEDEIAAEEENIEETVPLEISFGLPKVVADCVEAVFAAVSESADFAAVNISESSADKVITEGSGEGASDMSADALLIETTEPESNAATPEAGEANGVPFLPQATGMETISEVVCDDPNPTPANQDVPVEEQSVSSATICLVKVEHAHEEVTADDVVLIKGILGILDQKQLDDQPSKKCGSCPGEEIIIIEAPSNELVTTEELPEDSLSSPDDEVKLESIPYTTDVKAEVCQDVKTDVGPERVDEPEPSLVMVKENGDDAVAVEDVPALPEQKQLDNEPSNTYDSGPEEEIIIAETPSNELINIEEIPEDTLSSLPEVINTDKNAEVGEDVKTLVVQERDEETESSPAFVKDNAEVMMDKTATEEDVLNESVVVIAKEVIEGTNEESLANMTANQEELPVPPVTVLLVKVESFHEEVIADNPNVTDDVSGIVELKTPLPLENCNSRQEEGIIIVAAASNGLITIEELPEDTLSSPPEVITTIENAEVDEDVKTDVGPERVEETEPSLVMVKDNAEVMKEAATTEEDMLNESVVIVKEVAKETNKEPLENANPDKLSAPIVMVPLIKVGSACEEVIADDALAVEGVPGIPKQLDENCDSCPKKEIITVETPSNAIISFEELPEDTLTSPSAAITTNENTEVGEDVKTDMGPENLEEAELVIVKDDAEKIMEAAIDALSLEFESCTITLEEPHGIPLEEEAIAATTFVPLSREPAASFAITEEPVEAGAEQMAAEAIEALSNEIASVPQSVEEDTTREVVTVVVSSEEPMKESDIAEERTEVPETAMAQAESSKTSEQFTLIFEEPIEKNPSPYEEDATTEVLENILQSVVESVSAKLDVTKNSVEEPPDVPPRNTTEESETCASVQQDLVKENLAAAEVLLEDADKGTAVEVLKCIEQTTSTPVISKKPVEESANPLEPKTDVRVVIIETTEVREAITEEIMQHALLAAVEERPKDAASDEPASKSVKAILETIVEEIITKDVAAKCNLATSETVAPQIVAEGPSEEKAENESSTNSIDSTMDSQSVTSTDMEALINKLQSACISVVEKSMYRIGALKLSSVGYRITVSIHVAPKEEQK